MIRRTQLEMRASSSFDRATHERRDRESLHRMLSTPSSLAVPVWRNQNLIAPGPCAALPELGNAQELMDRADEIVWLGKYGAVGCFAFDISSSDEPLSFPGLMHAGQFADLRGVLGIIPEQDAELLAYARAILHWHRRQRFCGKCGRITHPKEGGHVRQCEGCEEKYFPRTDPAVMILICTDSHCLLARQRAFPQGMYSTLAGFVEPGESLEEAVIRETREEVGIDVELEAYRGSQPWPFPASLMLGFRVRARSSELTIDHEEIEDARWFTREELRAANGFFVPPDFSLARRLIQEFVEG